MNSLMAWIQYKEILKNDTEIIYSTNYQSKKKLLDEQI